MKECAFCNQPIEQSSIVYIEGKPYHDNCFKLQILILKLKEMKNEPQKKI